MLEVTESILAADDLPSPPGVALRLLDLYSKPDFKIHDMANVIRTDPALTGKIIQYCNSPILGLDTKTSSIDRAVVAIGTRAVKILALSFSLVHSKPETDDLGYDYKGFWNRSLANAVMARSICQNQGQDGNSEFLLGLMMNIGEVALGHTFSDQFSELKRQAAESNDLLDRLEVNEWGANHFCIGAEILEHWNFPKDVVQGVASYGQYVDSICDNADAEPPSDAVKNFAMADRAVSLLFAEELAGDAVRDTKDLARQWWGWTEQKFATAFDEAAETWQEFAQILKFDASKSQSLEQLERRAMKGISQLSMGIHNENLAINQENERLRVTAMFDALTGLKNRRAFDQEALAEWERSIRLQGPFMVMMVDIDHFKKVNDVHGHAIGDRALIAVGKALKNSARKYDTTYRFGGEEFVVVVPGCEIEHVAQTAERYREAVERLWIPLDKDELQVTVSIGVSVLDLDNVTSVKAMLEEADSLLYLAKKRGRNRVCFNPNVVAQPNVIVRMLEPLLNWSRSVPSVK
jgi:diguanylate cyclase (GGDEF)-like protein